MDDDLAFAWWCLIIGVLLVVMTVGRPWIARLPLSSGMFYLASGFALGPAGAGLLDIALQDDAGTLERVAEVAVLISLFVAGFKLGQRGTPDRWRAPIRLASLAMVVTVGLIALAGYFLLGLTIGAAVLLGAILAPTDPVLASDVQLGHPEDRDRLRFALTGEGALNDGTAFPFVMLGLGLLGLHELGPNGARWWSMDVAWAVTGGLACGFVLGSLCGRALLWLSTRAEDRLIAHEFVALGLIALAYGAAILLGTYGFLAVFAAGYAMRRAAHPAEPSSARPADDAVRSASLAAVLHFNEQAERFAEIAVVFAMGALAGALAYRSEAVWFAALVVLAVRPLAVVASLPGTRTSVPQRALIAWFGIRGAGSVYYLMYAITHGLAGPTADRLAALTVAIVVASIVLHGISVTPLMEWYERRATARR